MDWNRHVRENENRSINARIRSGEINIALAGDMAVIQDDPDCHSGILLWSIQV